MGNCLSKAENYYLFSLWSLLFFFYNVCRLDIITLQLSFKGYPLQFYFRTNSDLLSYRFLWLFFLMKFQDFSLRNVPLLIFFQSSNFLSYLFKFRFKMNDSTDTIVFNVNGRDIEARNPDPETSLAEYLRIKCHFILSF